MKYAKEIMDLMAACPNKKFRMKEIVNYVAPQMTATQKSKVSRQCLRVLQLLKMSGTISITKGCRNGVMAYYQWR